MSHLPYLEELKKNSIWRSSTTDNRGQKCNDDQDRPLYSKISYYRDTVNEDNPFDYVGFDPKTDKIFMADWYYRDGGANKVMRDQRDMVERLQRQLFLYMLENERLSALV